MSKNEVTFDLSGNEDAVRRVVRSMLDAAGFTEVLFSVNPEDRPESERWSELSLRARQAVAYEREVEVVAVGDVADGVGLMASAFGGSPRPAVVELLAAAGRDGWHAVVDAEGGLVCLVPPGGAVDERGATIPDALATVVAAVLNLEPSDRPPADAAALVVEQASRRSDLDEAAALARELYVDARRVDARINRKRQRLINAREKPSTENSRAYRLVLQTEIFGLEVLRAALKGLK